MLSALSPSLVQQVGAAARSEREAVMSGVERRRSARDTSLGGLLGLLCHFSTGCRLDSVWSATEPEGCGNERAIFCHSKQNTKTVHLESLTLGGPYDGSMTNVRALEHGEGAASNDVRESAESGSLA